MESFAYHLLPSVIAQTGPADGFASERIASGMPKFTCNVSN